MSAKGKQPTSEEVLDNFCLMMLEEFLVKKKMHSTLDSFRNEWQSTHQRPAEDVLLFSWYDVALRLRLPELLATNADPQRPVLDNLVRMLVRESALRNRRSEEVTVTGLAAVPLRRTALPPMGLTSSAATGIDDDQSFRAMTPPPASDTVTGNGTAKSSPASKVPPRLAGTTATDLDRRLKASKRAQDSGGGGGGGGGINTSSRNKTHSNEAWIPENARMRQFQRDLLVVQEVLQDTKVLEDSLGREMKRLMVSDLDRAKSEEQLDATRKVPCGCCTQMFLKVNLPMKVSRKAIQDIRVLWSGKLTSTNVFRGNSVRDITVGADKSGKRSTAAATSSSSASSGLEEDMSVNGIFPTCYDQVGVCRFCTQFFGEPEDYRPSFQNITFQERKAAHFEQKRREREYWDPLKMLEKDRTKQEEYEKIVELESQSSQATLSLNSSSIQ
jgi:hypothetical protein